MDHLPSLDLGALLTACLLFSAFAFGGAIVLLVGQNLRAPTRHLAGMLPIFGVYGIATLATLALIDDKEQVLVPLTLGLAGAVAGQLVFRNFSPAGRLLLAANAQ